LSDPIVNNSSAPAITVLMTGDLVLDVPEPDHWLGGIAPALRAADLSIGHLEVPHTKSLGTLAGDVPAPGADPAHLGAIARAGFGAVTLAGNHIADCGAQGIADTRDSLAALGIAMTGAGRDIRKAAAPAIINVQRCRIALLSYNAVGPENAWATATRAGCNYLRVETRDGSGIAPTAPLHRVSDEAIAQLKHDVDGVRQDADLVIVALHKGVVHTPALLAPYERPLAHAAIDAGADVVIGHHAHIAKGIEFYRGKPVFHGLGNGCVVTHALSPGQDDPARSAWVERRKTLFGFEPDPAYTLAPFHPEAVNAFMARLDWHRDGRLRAGIVPVDVVPPGRPILADAPRAREIVRYLSDITVRGGLSPLTLAWQDGVAWLS
jgi:poly-gamma-glutamate capsule biosynthesis protein CapA/YwtB (metallophosphatase superfamily)